jgi:hypothetical protein
MPPGRHFTKAEMKLHMGMLAKKDALDIIKDAGQFPKTIKLGKMAYGGSKSLLQVTSPYGGIKPGTSLSNPYISLGKGKDFSEDWKRIINKK